MQQAAQVLCYIVGVNEWPNNFTTMDCLFIATFVAPVFSLPDYASLLSLIKKITSFFNI